MAWPVGKQLGHACGQFPVRLVDGFQHILDASFLSELLEDWERCDCLEAMFFELAIGVGISRVSQASIMSSDSLSSQTADPDTFT